ncbi:uncharacterized protein LOC131236619 isoform X2 [Magnolia sinica]|uniref:uncharacterized protein LOC131236619 isoform X2 n=1 Tax=Magnolia sinica TaxID=86752 RepID=UPI00265AB9C9|nr:uncharacterized protein LOC131236619 isoform X2 [Magnolia sinica]
MVLKKRNADISVVSGGGIQRKSVEPVDHWAFLEEMEAPMWVDFTSEDQFLYKDIDNAWFRMEHPFHQRPSHHLILSFSLLSKRKMKSPELLQLSPKLPDSVSKSRGKHYRSRKWEDVEHIASTSKQHPIRILDGKDSSDVVHSNLTSTITSKYSNIRPSTSSGNPKSSSNPKENLTSECKSTITTTLKSPSIRTKSSGNLKSYSNPKASLTSECKSTSTITSKSPSIRSKGSFGDLKSTSNSNASTTGDSNQQTSIPESSNHMVGYTSRLLSSMRISLTKNCVTRHASRVEVKEGGLPKQRKSSTTSKSSVGSSFNPGCNIESVNLAVNEEGTPESRKDKNDVRPNNSKVSYVWKTSKCHVPDRGSNSNLKWGERVPAAEPVYKEAKAKVLHSSGPRKPLWSRNAADLPKEKLATKSKQITAPSKFSRVVGVGKENAATNMSRNQKASKQEIHVKDGDRLTDVKIKANGRAQGKKPTNATSRMPFR